MYTADMTREDATQLVKRLSGPKPEGYESPSAAEQLAWDLQDCRDRLAELDADEEEERWAW